MYSPIDNALMEFHQELCYFESFPNAFTNPFQTRKGFEKLYAKHMEINRNYGHLFDEDIRVASNKVWDSWQRFITPPHSHVTEIALDFRGLKSDIINFHKLLDTKIEKEKKMRHDLIHQ